MPECTCKGRNPSCCYCGGWGWIGDQIVPIVHDKVEIYGTLPQKKANKNFEIKNQCIEEDIVNQNNINISSKITANINSLKKKKEKQFLKCPICSQLIVQERIKKHFMQYHPCVKYNEKSNQYKLR